MTAPLHALRERSDCAAPVHACAVGVAKHCADQNGGKSVFHNAEDRRRITSGGTPLAWASVPE